MQGFEPSTSKWLILLLLAPRVSSTKVFERGEER
jgi:hypothetical protein